MSTRILAKWRQARMFSDVRSDFCLAARSNFPNIWRSWEIIVNFQSSRYMSEISASHSGFLYGTIVSLSEASMMKFSSCLFINSGGTQGFLGLTPVCHIFWTSGLSSLCCLVYTCIISLKLFCTIHLTDILLLMWKLSAHHGLCFRKKIYTVYIRKIKLAELYSCLFGSLS